MQTYKWDTVPAEQLADNMVRRMIVGAKEMLVHWEIKKGTLAARHSHPHEQMVVMVRGKVRLAVGDDETIIGPDDIVVIPPQMPHEGETLEDTVLIDIFSPPREDFLSGDRLAYLKQQ
jgi:quercetin dioxygenase-like cupin family protein